MALSGSSTGFDLLTALDDAVARRGGGWAQAERAGVALAVARSAGVQTSLPDDWVQRFGLDEVDAAILTVAAAAERDPALHLLLGLLAGDPGPARPTPALALELAGVPIDDPDGLSRCAPLAPLSRLGLLLVEGGDVLLARRLRVPDRVAGQLRGDGRPTPSVLGLFVEQVPIDVVGTEEVAAALAAGEQIVWVHAPSGAPGTALAAGAVGLLDRSALVADLHRIPVGRAADTDGSHALVPNPVQMASVLRDLVLEAAMAGSVLILAGCEWAAGQMQTLHFAPIPVIGVSALPWDPTWTIGLPVTVAATRLTVAERLVLWQAILPDVEIPREIAALRLTPEQMWQVARAARRDADLAGLSELDVAHLTAAARRLGRGKDDQGAGATIDDLVLPDHARREVGRLLDWARYRDEVMGRSQLQGKGGKGTGICALFSGSPGTGKTLAAHVVADTLGIQLLHVELASVVSKYIGESEKNLESVFAEAESLNSVLFFDEADALFGARSGTKDAHDRYANQEISYLLQRMESFDGITILATNLRGNLDPAFARRLHFIVTFPDPDLGTRARLWEHHLAAVPSIDQQDLPDTGLLARTAEVSGGDIRNVVLAAVYDAVATDEPVGMRHVGAALARELIKLGRRVPPADWLNGAGRADSTLLAQVQQGGRSA